MNTSLNVALETAATILLTLGVVTVRGDWVAGVIELVVGAALYVIYELTPSK